MMVVEETFWEGVFRRIGWAMALLEKRYGLLGDDALEAAVTIICNSEQLNQEQVLRMLKDATEKYGEVTSENVHVIFGGHKVN